MRCWRCNGLDGQHKDWCSMPGGCDHCGWKPHRNWCLGDAETWSRHRGGYGLPKPHRRPVPAVLTAYMPGWGSP